MVLQLVGDVLLSEKRTIATITPGFTNGTLRRYLIPGAFPRNSWLGFLTHSEFHRVLGDSNGFGQVSDGDVFVPVDCELALRYFVSHVSTQEGSVSCLTLKHKTLSSKLTAVKSRPEASSCQWLLTASGPQIPVQNCACGLPC